MNVWAVPMVVAGGLFAGGAATFAWSRVPIWRRMPLPQFVSDFSQTIQWTDKVQPALLVGAIVATIGFAATSDGSGRLLAAIGGAGLVVTLVLSVAILVPLQRRIIRSSTDRADAIEDMRLRWFRGNLGRSVVSALSFALIAVAATI